MKVIGKQRKKPTTVYFKADCLRQMILQLDAIAGVYSYDPWKVSLSITSSIPLFVSNATNTNTVIDVLVPIEFCILYQKLLLHCLTEVSCNNNTHTH